ncbi:MAG: hypothetical protein HOQ15_15565 [Gemmatimonadaceae bacterium]|nr:hypothetical protein [Gemmatimonadaceae bacterium]
MPLVPLVIALQLQTASVAALPAARPAAVEAADSARDARRARDAQASFERARRSNLPWEGGSGGRCEVRLGRYCWWYDETAPPLPPENEATTRRRAELIAQLDTLAELHPGDDWLAGMRVHYRVDARRTDAADTVARGCRSTRWWCDALLGYAAHVRGDAALADSAFAAALAGMDEATRCQWTDIHTLLPSDSRERYEELTCADRAPMERRYWLLGWPRLAAPANEWRNEFFTRRVQAWLAERSRTPHNLSWGKDAEELLLRYGWPNVWGRVEQTGGTYAAGEPSVIGHDPSPSFAFAPQEALLDSLASGGDDGWDLRSRYGESRFAPIHVRRIAPISAQLARFRRGDSVLVVAAYATADDSLAHPISRLAAALDDQHTVVGPPDSLRVGTTALRLPSAPRLVGIEVTDTTTGTLARRRMLFRPDTGGVRVALSDLLLYRPGAEPAPVLDSALARAIPGDTVSRDRPVGIFWETYGLAEGGESVDVAVTVERIDRSWFRSARQRLGLGDQDTPLRIRWTDARSAASGVAPHAVSLDLGNLPGGRYRLTLTLTPDGAPAVASTGEIELREP